MDLQKEVTRAAARWARLGLLINAALAVVKLIAGVLGNSYALVADAVESSADIFSSVIVWGGLRISSRSADEKFPYGYGKAEPLAAAVVSLMLVGAAIGISIQAVREILTPHHVPAPFTLVVLVGVIVIKEVLFRRVIRAGMEVESRALQADAWHHRSDALTSTAAAVGISVAVVGGPDWAAADDWAALAASVVILYNGLRILRPAVEDLMDRTPDVSVLNRIREAALMVPGVEGVETLKVRRVGFGYFVNIHIEADPEMSLRDAHFLSGKAKAAVRASVHEVSSMVVHMEPFEGGPHRSAEPVAIGAGKPDPHRTARPGSSS